MHVLARPVWSSLASCHLELSKGGPLARRYARNVNVFASARDDNPEALAVLAELVRPGHKVYVLQVPAVVVPHGLRVLKTAKGVQMAASQPVHVDDDEGLVTLTDADAPEMLALAILTKPGPFLSQTSRMGTFLGVRIGGRLAAMAGERMRMHGYTEVSGVCTHPDFRGRGLARRLSAVVAARIQARGDVPFLHAWASNKPAISLYEQLGFRVRAEVNVAVLARSGNV